MISNYRYLWYLWKRVKYTMKMRLLFKSLSLNNVLSTIVPGASLAAKPLYLSTGNENEYYLPQNLPHRKDRIFANYKFERRSNTAFGSLDWWGCDKWKVPSNGAYRVKDEINVRWDNHGRAKTTRYDWVVPR